MHIFPSFLVIFGYFDNKKELPQYINSIGIVTASSGAALQDILFVFNSNKFDGKIYIITNNGNTILISNAM